jgi:hypothetical protein
MTVNINVIHQKDFIRMTVTGVLNFAVGKQALFEIASQVEQPGEYQTLIDTREADAVISLAGIFELDKIMDSTRLSTDARPPCLHQSAMRTTPNFSSPQPQTGASELRHLPTLRRPLPG